MRAASARPAPPTASPASVEDWLGALRAHPDLGRALRHHRRLPARPPRLARGLPPGFAALEPVLRRRGIAAPYVHQTRALELLEEGRDVVLATSTASGKSLVYNLRVLRAALERPQARALYLFPLKALSQDQRKQLAEDVAALGADVRVEIYDGDTAPARRKRIRDDPPQVLITTPDMLHVGILPHHGAWGRFLAGLETVVLDELHAYRGVFGAHVAQVMRRLLRVAAHHGAAPRFVAASATVANPGELASAVVGRPVTPVQDDGAPRPARDVVLLDPVGSPYTTAARLFRLSVERGLRTIAFTKARKITELIHTWIVEAAPELGERVSSYRSGFLPAERREIEARLFSGELLGVVSTSALEMGIDVGGLDVCILVGYPGSQMATWQRGGRVGRVRDAAIALVAQPDALDQYLVAHPRVFFERDLEHAVCDPGNVEVLGAHLPCAAAEVPLRRGETWLDEPAVRAAVERAEAEAALLRSEGGDVWFPVRRRPHREVDLRQVGEGWTIQREPEGGERPAVVGSIGGGRVFSECHPGAIYLHRGRSYRVTRLELDERTAFVRPVDSAWYTRALSEKETEILSRERIRPGPGYRLAAGQVRVTTRVTGFERRRVHGQDLLATEPLDLPPQPMETQGLWLEIPEEVAEAVRAAGGHPMGGLHAVEHAALSLFPLFALCDRFDVGGISFRAHPQLRTPAIFFYDGQPGGVGIAASLYSRTEALLEATLELVEDCPCEEGCPACVHSPKCGSGNRPIDKAAARTVLRLLLGRQPLPATQASPGTTAPAPAPAPADPEPAAPARPRVLFLDLETQRSAEEVGGWHNAHLMRVAVAVLWDAARERFETYGESEVAALLARLREAELVVGFNSRRFDYRVLRGYTDQDLERLPTFDVLEAVRARLGFRLALGHLAEETLGVSKGGDGLQSLRWWREGRVAEVERYCRRDVEILRDLVAFAEVHGHLLFRTRSGERVRLPAHWDLAELCERARAGAAVP